jgi:DDE superfamily endonuclease
MTLWDQLVGLCQVGGWWIGCEGSVLPVPEQGSRLWVASQQPNWPRSADAWRPSPTTCSRPATCRSACPRRVLPAWVAAGGPPQVDRATRPAPGEVHDQALHHLVAVSAWDWRPVRRRLAEVLGAALFPDRVGGRRHRQPPRTASTRWGAAPGLGDAGQTANCQLGVSVNAVTEHAWCRLGWRLFLPSAGMRRRWPRGGRPAGCPRAYPIGPSGSWGWTCWMSWPAGSFARRCCWPTRARGGGRVPCWAGRSPAPLGGRGQGRPQRLPQPVGPTVAPQGPPSPPPLPRHALLAAPARDASWAAGLQRADLAAWEQGAATRPLPGAGVRPAGSPHAGWPERPAKRCRCAGCWPNGHPASPRRPRTGWPACPRPPRWWTWSAWPGCGGEGNRTTANAKVRSGWTTWRGAASWAGTTT